MSLESDLTRGAHTTQDAVEAAVLMTLGCNPIEGGEVSNVYTEAKPRRPGQPGEVFYHVSRDSSFPGTSSTVIAKGFKDKDGIAAEELDALIDSIPDANIRDQIKSRLPRAIASFCRAAIGNREKLKSWWRAAPEEVYIRKGKKGFLVPRKNPGLVKKLGL